MMNHFLISGFKCFEEQERFILKNLTVLCGSNGTGKSSLIQALLLVRLSIERNSKSKSIYEFDSNSWGNIPTPLNDGYELALGTFEDIINQTKTKESIIKFQLDEDKFTIPFPNENDDNTAVNVVYSGSTKNSQSSFWRKKEFYYLAAERLGPRHGLSNNFTDFLHCGFKGEFTAQVLLNEEFLKVPEKRRFPNSKSSNLKQQVDVWLDFICPGTSVVAEPLGSMNAQIRLRNRTTKSYLSATNIGFGISYALPIIVNGLIAKKECVFIVENPEAHLHPKGQSNIGYFLGVLASSGLKVIIETHSEHVINGIRRATHSKTRLSVDDIIIYFFNGYDKEKDKVIEIKLDKQSNLNPFPRDFFDQVQQDMAEIFRLMKDKNG